MLIFFFFCMSEMVMGLHCKGQVGVEVVKFWLSKDNGELIGHILSTTLCFWISLSLVIWEMGIYIYFSGFLGTCKCFRTNKYAQTLYATLFILAAPFIPSPGLWAL